MTLEEFSRWQDVYADAMRDVYQRFPEHPDVIALTAEALVTRTPWQLWDVTSGSPTPGADTLEAIEMLELGMCLSERNDDPPHLGILHIYLHALEMSPTPEKALPAAVALYGLSPDNGHLQHMPSHIYVLCGRYADAIEANDAALVADDKYVDHAGALNFYAVNRGHDLMMKMHAGMLSGQFQVSQYAAEQLVERLPEELLRVDKPYMAMLLEGFYASMVHVLVRFGRWRSIVDAKLPDDLGLYPSTFAMCRYARGVAYSALGQIEAAETERVLFLEALEALPENLITGNSPTGEVLAVGVQMLDGELCYRKQNYHGAFQHLREAVSLNDALNFSEPWAWMHPPRHALGALLLEQNRYAEAEQVYRADLGLDETVPRCQQHPNNVWALHGYVECLKHRGDRTELRRVEPDLVRALALADVVINASCCCRTSVY